MAARAQTAECGIAPQNVGPFPAQQGVVAATALEQVITLTAIKEVIPSQGCRSRSFRRLIPVAAVSVQCVVARSAYREIVATLSFDPVMPRSSVESVAPCRSSGV